MTGEFNPGSDCKVRGSDGWCVLVESCKGACLASSGGQSKTPAELSPSVHLGETQRALAASQADLTAMERERDELAERNSALLAQVERLNKAWAEECQAADLARAELVSARQELGQLHEQIRRKADG